MKGIRPHIILLYILFFSISFSCKSRKPVAASFRNLSYLYNPENSDLHPLFNVYHINDSVSYVSIKISTRELLFSRGSTEKAMQAFMFINLNLLDITNGLKQRVLVDSTSVLLPVCRDTVGASFVTGFKLKAKRGHCYYLMAKVLDQMRKDQSQSMVYIDKLDYFGRQNFCLLTADSSKQLFSPIVDSLVAIRIASSKKLDTLYICYSKEEPALPSPPFLSSVYKFTKFVTDSQWMVRGADTLWFCFKAKGRYFIQTDTCNAKGLMLFNFAQSYPKPTTAGQLVGPMAYITTSDEMKTLQNAVNRKLIVDSIWLHAANNTEIAREMIRVYYSRVTLANWYFLADREGWKTDRGMIYIVYGIPTSVERDDKSETWYYYDKQRGNPVSFTFDHVENVYSDNVYFLQRSSDLNQNWRETVESWRNGKIFIIEE